MLKKALLSLASIFLIWQSYDLLGNIDRIGSVSWALALFVAWVINMYITGIFAFAGFAFPTQRLMPGAYYTVRRPEQLRQVCDILGVERFRKMLLTTLWRSQKQRKRYFDGSAGGLAHLEEQSRKSEFGHLIPLVILSVVSLYLLTLGLLKLGIFTLLINLLGNLYPVLLQRRHRMRIQQIRLRGARRPAAS